MHKIVTYARSVAPAVQDQIAQMTKENLTDLSMLGVPSGNLIYPLYQHTLSEEILLYIKRIGKMEADAPIRLVVAYADDTQEVVVGFVLFLPVKQDHTACGLTYMAVGVEHRRKGIATDMLSAVANESPHIELTCFIDKVPVYESMGFHVIGVRDTQIVMNNRQDPSMGEMTTVFAEALFNTPQAQMIQHKLFKLHGMRKLREAEKRLDRLVDELKRTAQQFIDERAQEIVLYRRPGATVEQNASGRFELRGVESIDCAGKTEKAVWAQAARLIDKRIGTRLRFLPAGQV
ncbi:GNAT family N-acetyltransferase [Pseudomonas sp. RP23018S]|uniref:GNAT family N-acetyltransferase n=1 Tax=Pseudomonas sp. RP23018S TaxID=3096037 RepID=UPI002ACAE571|nr:GNAT family N-acetyltransferase [Pseudomonas sp. RP23018S]MDZ5605186.1 GNAT family N-acetyltransferase [Pseudomonas sp. RP23018S]